MLTINTRFSRFVWYGPAVAIVDLPWKALIGYLGVTNGSAFPSYVYGRGLNSYAKIQPGDVLQLDLPSVVAGTASTYLQLDNGTAPSAPGPTDYAYVAPAGTVSPTLFNRTPFTQKCRFTLAALPAGVGVDFSLNGSSSYQSITDLNAAVGALTDLPYYVALRQTRSATTSDTTVTLTATPL